MHTYDLATGDMYSRLGLHRHCILRSRPHYLLLPGVIMFSIIYSLMLRICGHGILRCKAFTLLQEHLAVEPSKVKPVVRAIYEEQVSKYGGNWVGNSPPPIEHQQDTNHHLSCAFCVLPAICSLVLYWMFNQNSNVPHTAHSMKGQLIKAKNMGLTDFLPLCRLQSTKVLSIHQIFRHTAHSMKGQFTEE